MVAQFTTIFCIRKEYPDKSQCFECGEEGHLSYKCPVNALGDRQPPPKKSRKRKNLKRKVVENKDEEIDEDSDDETLSRAILYEVILIISFYTFIYLIIQL